MEVFVNAVLSGILVKLLPRLFVSTQLCRSTTGSLHTAFLLSRFSLSSLRISALSIFIHSLFDPEAVAPVGVAG